jgi:hypothetical protein
MLMLMLMIMLMLMLEHARTYEQKRRAEKNRPGGPKGGVAQKGVIHVSIWV